MTQRFALAVGGRTPAAGRNDPCPCGSGRKFKRCCGAATEAPPGGVEPSGLQGPAWPGLTPDPPAPAARPTLEHAARLREKGHWAASLAALQDCARRYPDDPLAVHDLGATFLYLQRLPEAVTQLRRAALLKPDFVKAHYHLGLALQQQGDDAEAITAFRQVVALAPRHEDAQSRLGDLLDAEGEREAAVGAYRRAAAAAPSSAAGRLCQAKALLAEEQFSAAERALRRAIALDPVSSAAHWILGRVLTALGRFEEAVGELERAKALSPHEVAILQDLVTAKRCGEEDRPRIAEMLAALAGPGLTDKDRIGLEYALGKAFDDLGDYPEAMRHYDAANRLNASHVRFDRAALVRDNDRLLARFTPALQALPRQGGRDDETAILIVGMPRSGTTLVEQILSSHPAIGAGGELDFWSKTAKRFAEEEAAAPSAADLDRIGRDYLAFLHRLAPGKARVTDKMPANFRWLGLIHLTLPSVRIIHCRRDPIDTCLSNYFAYFGRRHSYSCTRGDLVFFYREYTRMMAHWRAILPPERLLEVDYESLIAAPERVSREMIAFAGLAWTDACLNPERNARVIYTSSKWQARQPVYGTSVKRWRRYAAWLGELGELLPEAALFPGENSG